MINNTTMLESAIVGAIGEYMTTRDLVIKIFGRYDTNSPASENQRRAVNRCLSVLVSKGKLIRKQINKKTFGYVVPTKCTPSYDTTPCGICGKTKYTSDLDEDGFCAMCHDLANQTTSPPNPHLVSTASHRKIDRTFGNLETPNSNPILNTSTPSPAPGKKTIDIVRHLMDTTIRVTTAGGRLIHGTLNDVTDDGFIGIQTDYGPSVVRLSQIAAIQQWDLPKPEFDKAYDQRSDPRK